MDRSSEALPADPFANQRRAFLSTEEDYSPPVFLGQHYDCRVLNFGKS